MTEENRAQGAPGPEGDTVTIYINRNAFQVKRQALTGSMLRQLQTPPIGPDFDVFQVAPGESEDLVVRDDEIVEIEDGTAFFSAPRMILAG